MLRVVQAIEKEGHDLNMELLKTAIEYKAVAERAFTKLPTREGLRLRELVRQEITIGQRLDFLNA